MAISRKRKATAIEDSAPVTRTQKSLHAFGTVGKPHQKETDGKKRKTVHQREQTPPPAPITTTNKANSKRKRTAELSDVEEEITVCPRSTAAKKEQRSKVMSTPRSKRVKNVLPSPAETPTRGAAALFDKLNIDVNSKAIPLKLGGELHAPSTPPLSPVREEDDMHLSILAELADLRHLYSSFLAAISMHYSHNGISAPVDVDSLLDIITKHYKKRSVKVEDLQRILALSSRLDDTFTLENYGRGGIRLTRSEPRGRAVQRATSFVDEEKLKQRFGDALRKSWQSWEACTAKENRSPAAFLAHLPIHPVLNNASVEKAAPVFARGQQRLADLKASQAAAQKPSILTRPVVEPTAVPARSLQAAQNRGTALLDRILAKQTLASTLPAGPTKSQLERRSALHRIEEITRILSMLAGVKQRCSLSMQVVTQQLQQSLRNPISREEVERCLDLMSEEIVPSFVKVVSSGEVKGVMITKAGNVGLVELRERVEKACA
ncbi:unnamed protein product [Zymoseptoria tritici ST99CH_1A5]|uniref:DNA replication factor Cdt1 C-terminal domain-containing protein n=1 Tax=Zymoseptoria tritici ST99CH_1A5 TaxID=1276529 RepID=A0A1Y6L6N6_ZYMTR|nr:unnamed protein product [Zymoseptoria tritici ST99CH_1A5]